MSTENESAETTKPSTQDASDQKPLHMLPSERLAVDRQLKALEAFAASYVDGEPVSNEKAGRGAEMAAATIVVTNAFFCEMGLLTRAAAGQFVPSEIARDYQHACAWDRDNGTDTAGHKLAPAFADKGLSKVLIPMVRVRGSMSEDDALAILGDASKAKPKYKGQLRALLQFMIAAKLLTSDGGMIKAAAAQSTGTQSGNAGGGGGVGGDDKDTKTDLNSDRIPPDAPAFYLDKERKRKVTLIAPDTADKAEVARIKKWIDLLYFVEEDTPK